MAAAAGTAAVPDPRELQAETEEQSPTTSPRRGSPTLRESLPASPRRPRPPAHPQSTPQKNRSVSARNCSGPGTSTTHTPTLIYTRATNAPELEGSLEGAEVCAPSPLTTTATFCPGRGGLGVYIWPDSGPRARRVQTPRLERTHYPGRRQQAGAGPQARVKGAELPHWGAVGGSGQILENLSVPGGEGGGASLSWKQDTPLSLAPTEFNGGHTSQEKPPECSGQKPQAQE